MLWVASMVEATHSVMHTSRCWPSPVMLWWNRAMVVAPAPFSPPSYWAWKPPCFRGSRSLVPLMLMMVLMA